MKSLLLIFCFTWLAQWSVRQLTKRHRFRSIILDWDKGRVTYIELDGGMVRRNISYNLNCLGIMQ